LTAQAAPGAPKGGVDFFLEASEVPIYEVDDLFDMVVVYFDIWLVVWNINFMTFHSVGN